MRILVRRSILLLPLLAFAAAASAQNLPPGIQKKVDEGKPLPPGIEKKFEDSRPLPPGIGSVSTAPAVPEPGALALFATGMALYAATLRRREG